MLNLKDLEAKINASLERETRESLTEWLAKERGGDINKYSKTNLDYLKSFLYTSSTKQNNSVTFISENSTLEQDYAHYTSAA